MHSTSALTIANLGKWATGVIFSHQHQLTSLWENVIAFFFLSEISSYILQIDTSSLQRQMSPHCSLLFG